MRRPILILFLALGANLAAQDITKLPDWAARAVRMASDEAAPADADAWVLLDRTEIAYTGDGEIRKRRFRVVRVLSERGIGQGTFVLFGLGGKASKVKKLKGWNLRPDSTVVKLDSDDVVTFNDAGSEEFSTGTATGAVLDRVVKGSLVAFESQEVIQSPLGPVAQAGVMEGVPVRVFELEVAKKEGWFTNLKAVDVKVSRHQFDPWIPKVEPLGEGGFRAMNVPARPKDEGGHPHESTILPRVEVRFIDPASPLARMWTSWDEVARWNLAHFQSALGQPGLADLQGKQGLEGLRALWAWMGRALVYKQVYLAPERGWIPEASQEVGRKRYGDCKDLTSFFLAEAKGLGFTPLPALARIVDGKVDPASEPFPFFNHVISALRLERSLGLAAEVETPKGRFLLVDPTDPYTPLGHLGSGHQGRSVMLCLPEGALWVAIPDKAILADRLQVDLQAEAAGTALKGTVKMAETGDYWGLRVAAHRGGTKAVRDLLMSRHFDLPATAQFEVVRMGDPLDLSKPFDLELKLNHPEGLRRNGGEYELPAWGLPGAFGLIQKAGVPRRYPVESRSSGDLVFHGSISLPVRVQPVLPERKGESPFRTFQWTASAKPQGEGTRLELSLDHHLRPATFGFDQRDKGLQAWKQDRALMKGLREDGLAFKIGS